MQFGELQKINKIIHPIFKNTLSEYVNKCKIPNGARFVSSFTVARILEEMDFELRHKTFANFSHTQTHVATVLVVFWRHIRNRFLWIDHAGKHMKIPRLPVSIFILCVFFRLFFRNYDLRERIYRWYKHLIMISLWPNTSTTTLFSFFLSPFFHMKTMQRKNVYL